MLAPFLLGLTVLVIIPAIASLAVAFFDYTPLKSTTFPWDGLDQFSLLGANSQFWRALGNSLLYTLLSVPLRMLGVLGLALFLEKRRKGIGVVRAAAYLPTIIPDVAYALTWLWIVNPLFGPINQVLRSLHLPTQSWLVEGGGALGIVVAMSTWQIGEGVVVTLAALRDIPQDLYDISVVDGAGWWTRLRTLILPLIAPTFLLLLFRTTIMSLQDNFAPSLHPDPQQPHLSQLLPLFSAPQDIHGGVPELSVQLRCGHNLGALWGHRPYRIPAICQHTPLERGCI